MASTLIRTFAGLAVAGVMAAPSTAVGQILRDGDLEDLEQSTLPDCERPAGAWQFPENYIEARLCEVDPFDFRIEADPMGLSRNSLLMKISNPESEVHLTNIFTRKVGVEEGIVTVKFDVFGFGGVAGGIVYVGGDHGGGGFDAETDRGPELMWMESGELAFVAPEPEPIAEWRPDTWQHVKLEINLERSTFDLYHTNETGAEPELVGEQLPFRSERLEMLDRFSIAHVGRWAPENVAFFDNVSVEVDGGAECYADCDGNGELDFFDFLCFQNAFSGGERYADCDGNGELDFFDFLCFQNEFSAGCP